MGGDAQLINRTPAGSRIKGLSAAQRRSSFCKNYLFKV
jgi:hypothetical protein